MASANTAVSLAIQRRLADTGGMTTDTIELAIEQSKENGKPFFEHLVEENYITSGKLAQIFSLEYSIPIYDIEQHNLELSPQEVVDPKLVKKHNALPLSQRGNKLFVAIGNPTDQRALTDIRFQTGLNIEPVIADAKQLHAVIERFFKSQEDDINDSLGGEEGEFSDIDVEAVDEDPGKDEGAVSQGDEAPIVKFVNKVLIDTIRSGASDIHFEPYEKSYRVRARIDGILQEITRPPVKLAPRLAARLKVMSKMDISERRKPQDGRI
ncbi:MAG: ATPase, T2SS/T4P/T4SS family, partial [Pseudomonadales bacterium]